MSTYLPDSSAFRSGAVARLIESGVIKGRILLHRSVLAEFEDRALGGDFSGLEAVKQARRAAESKGLTFTLYGGNGAEAATSVREAALTVNGVLVTSDYVAAKVAEALGVKVIYDRLKGRLKLEDFFEDDVMSVHLKEGLPPRVKRGAPGKWVFEVIGDWKLSKNDLEGIVEEVIERAKTFEEGFIESERPGSTIVQLGAYRIVITKPPFSDGLELTAVRPIVKLSLYDYRLPEKLLTRLEERAEGILIAGAPGMGKTTFAQALAEFYLSKNKVVKTIEAPRDLQLPADVTQYSKVAASSEEIHDILLLGRPDYTIFDEMRDTNDFKLYADLRLAGVGMVGVVHATTPIDAIQRFVGRVELGMIPSIIDTVIFIKDGNVEKVYAVETVIKVPYGIKEEDLARPVVVVKDFMTDEPEYEMYVFGEKTFVVPTRRHQQNDLIVKRAVENLVKRYTSEFKVEVYNGGVTVYVPRSVTHTVMKKCRKKLERAGRRMGINEVSIQPMDLERA
ncbi:MAG: ATPase, T2SS/T4P/T4SS family [Candidatus Nezhaarchaeales archaeon]